MEDTEGGTEADFRWYESLPFPSNAPGVLARLVLARSVSGQILESHHAMELAVLRSYVVTEVMLFYRSP